MTEKRLPVFLLCVLLLNQGIVNAEEMSITEAMELGKSFGSDNQTSLEGLATNQDANTVPGFQGTDVPETQYGNNPMAIEDEARLQVNQNDTGSFVTESAVSRPQFQFDRETDPLLTRANAIQDDPESVAGSIEAEFSACQSSTITTPPEYSEEVCTEWRETELRNCTETLQLTCNRPVECDAGGIQIASLRSDMRWDYTYPTLTLGTNAGNIWSGYCTLFDRRTTFDIEDINKVKEFTLIQAGFDDWIRITVNGNVVRVGPFGGDRLEVIPSPIFGGLVSYSASMWGGCELSTVWNQSLNINIKPYLQTGSNTIDMRVIVAGTGQGWMKFRATQYCDCDWSESWHSTCGGLEGELANGLCAQPTRTCTQPAETRIINGMSAYRDCWAFENTYECAAPSTTEEDYCGELRDRGCSQISSQCTGTLNNGLCESYEQTYQCETSPGTATEIMDCGGQTMCMEGGCFDTAYEPSNDLGQAAASLGAINEAGDDFDVDLNEIFKGDDLRCSKAILGFSNCCKIDGWGQDIGLDQCSTNEQRLALSRKGGLCHYVGSYCSNRNLFGCTSRKETHCCFKSKLARIIHEQGRVQLGMNWGSSEAPNCTGISIEQLQSLDFSQIDFSEFYADAMGDANSPDSGELQGIIDNYIQQSYQ